MEILDIIKKRRSIDPDLFNGEEVDKSIIVEMLEAANWAPTHGFTEPWRFIVYAKDKVQDFGNMHAEMYKSLTDVAQFLEKKYDKIKYRAKNCSHVIVCVNKRGDKSNIPEIEELAATSAAIENMLLVATAHNVGTFWSTGGMCYHPKIREILGFDEQDKIIGIIYVGKYKEADYPVGRRTTDALSKVVWK